MENIDHNQPPRPLEGIKVIEMAGLAPSPYCGMLLADFGAEVVVVDRISGKGIEIPNLMDRNPFYRGKRFMKVNLKAPQGAQVIRDMIRHYDVLIEPYRPGVMEGLGLGPDEALQINPSLIYARLTGWGQTGPYAKMAGHDINYIALSGALSLFRRKGQKPLAPANILGDFAGGGLLCAMGILLALLERHKSGKGQVIDVAMLDGALNLITFFFSMWAHGLMTLEIGTNMLDSGAHYYETYETADGKFLAVGAIEERFYRQLLEIMGLATDSLPPQNQTEAWPQMKERFQEVFKTKTRDEWMSLFEGTDACVAPVLDLDEVHLHPHNKERGILVEIAGVRQPLPAPRLSRTPGRPGDISQDTVTESVLSELGYTMESIQELVKKGILQ